jgi:hypothetical protein
VGLTAEIAVLDRQIDAGIDTQRAELQNQPCRNHVSPLRRSQHGLHNVFGVIVHYSLG